ncbi:Receptor-type guanylate cyclase gcy [Seminavis robusta]|uniref:Receptor-type guanylate cyclase gcy n=1 Tax=Seminavis robusta TaxID=568900 RepID=A0A9N8DFI5_9STRA|nr:Receptor-type guanylate cyclase gcy [Seminavis robusta]|eukprot:Sro116_g057220.1 Receptor-type guanylate cyclase gcy (928) ;mRNA; r:109740-113427
MTPSTDTPTRTIPEEPGDDGDLMDQSRVSRTNRSFNDDEPEKIMIANREDKAVCRFRTLLALVLVVVATGVSTAVYMLTRNGEVEDFERQYQDHAQKVAASFTDNAALRLGAIELFAVSIASNARARGETWPMVTIPDYQRVSSYILELSAVMSLTFHPLVHADERTEWGEYSGNNTEWIDQGTVYQEQRKSEDYDYEEEKGYTDFLNKVFRGPVEDGMVIRPYIFNLTADGISLPPDDAEHFLPWWQFAPFIEGVNSGINYNTFSSSTRGPDLQTVMATQKPLVTPAWDYSLQNRATVARKAVLNMYLMRWKDGGKKYEDGPASDLYFPVFESYEDEDTYMDIPPEERTMVGVLSAYVYWQIYFENVLPDADNAQGVIVVLENNCDQAFTYVINGASASYVGMGDLHDPKYDDLVVSTGYGAFLGGHAATGDFDNQCIYGIKVYPSVEMEDHFLTSMPLIFTLVVVAVFVVTSLIFVLYDVMVEKRQTAVMKKAVQSTEVVNSLYPAAVRDRLFDASATKSVKTDSSSFLVEQPNGGGADEEPDGIVADLYNDSTILFADLAGFTQWSSTKEPKHVFQLLETLYAEFDRIAKKRRVFKVETIGDCYLAITGVPRPQSRHALIMARFAHECRTVMNKVIHSKLVHTLGEETASLQMRVGLHSGPVTAGVLRGDRARFQLFGDTVNTASRMESTGLAGRIQASKATADLIVAAGKGSWVTQREGGVEAKGKGNMETFWIDPQTEPTVTGSVVSGMTTSSGERGSTGFASDDGCGTDGTGAVDLGFEEIVDDKPDTKESPPSTHDDTVGILQIQQLANKEDSWTPIESSEYDDEPWVDGRKSEPVAMSKSRNQKRDISFQSYLTSTDEKMKGYTEAQGQSNETVKDGEDNGGESNASNDDLYRQQRQGRVDGYDTATAGDDIASQPSTS